MPLPVVPSWCPPIVMGVGVQTSPLTCHEPAGCATVRMAPGADRLAARPMELGRVTRDGRPAALEAPERLGELGDGGRGVGRVAPGYGGRAGPGDRVDP